MVVIVDLCGNGSNENPGLISNFLLDKDTVSPAGIVRRIAALRRQSTIVYDVSLLKKKRQRNSSMRV